ncbi:MAG TPA: hypothetical protein GXX28_10495, partial [Firmicutes bacterium]|nr:hypothetical protein [Bacillota bacterium]
MSVKLVKADGTEYIFPLTFRVEGWPSESAIPSLTVEGRHGAVVDDADIVERERTITVSGTLYADTAADLQAVYDALAAFLNSPPRKMRLYADESEERFFWVRKQTLSHRFVQRSGRTLAEVSIVFRSSDPFMYGALRRMPLVYPISFFRSSVAYKSDGTQVAANVPRFEAGKFGQAIMVEAGTTNLVPNPSFETDSNADGLADNWGVYASWQSFSIVSPGFCGGKAQRGIANGTTTTPRFMSASLSTTPGTTYTVSVWAKAASGLTLYCNV